MVIASIQVRFPTTRPCVQLPNFWLQESITTRQQGESIHTHCRKLRAFQNSTHTHTCLSRKPSGNFFFLHYINLLSTLHAPSHNYQSLRLIYTLNSYQFVVIIGDEWRRKQWVTNEVKKQVTFFSVTAVTLPPPYGFCFLFYL